MAVTYSTVLSSCVSLMEIVLLTLGLRLMDE